MNKSYFETRKSEIQSEIDSWRQELKDLEDEYISSNQKFPIGSKVCITTPEHEKYNMFNRKIIVPEEKRFAYITGYNIIANEVVPILMKVKKDGTISKIKDYFYPKTERIELT